MSTPDFASWLPVIPGWWVLYGLVATLSILVTAPITATWLTGRQKRAPYVPADVPAPVHWFAWIAVVSFTYAGLWLAGFTALKVAAWFLFA